MPRRELRIGRRQIHTGDGGGVAKARGRSQANSRRLRPHVGNGESRPGNRAPRSSHRVNCNSRGAGWPPVAEVSPPSARPARPFFQGGEGGELW